MLLDLLVSLLVIYTLLTVSIYFFWMRTSPLSLPNEKNICLLIAHPDDEVMFFGPSMRALASRNKIFVLCMTRGDFYGAGETRVREMRESCENLVGGRLLDLTIVNEPHRLADSPLAKWDQTLALDLISTYLKRNSIHMLITFDRDGVSSHANHCELFKLSRELTACHKQVDFFCLETVNRLRKYSFLFDILPTLVLSRRELVFVNDFADYRSTLGSMMKHKSQLVWFRWLYVFTSRYMLLNNLRQF